MRAEWLIKYLLKSTSFDQAMFTFHVVDGVPVAVVDYSKDPDYTSIQLRNMLLEVCAHGAYYLVLDLSKETAGLPSTILGALYHMHHTFSHVGQGTLAVVVNSKALASAKVSLMRLGQNAEEDSCPVYTDSAMAVQRIKLDSRCYIRGDGVVTKRRIDLLAMECANKKPHLVIDMSNVTHICAFSTVCLLSLMHGELSSTGRHVTIIMPRAANVRQFLAVTGFVKHLPEGTTVDNWSDDPVMRETRPDVYGIEAFRATGSLAMEERERIEDEIARRIGDFRTKRSAPRVAMGGLLFVAAELVDNLKRHSDGRGFVLVQRSRDKKQVQVAISDYGIGLRASFRQVWHRVLTTDSEAVSQALQIREAAWTKVVSAGDKVERIGQFGLGTIRELVYYEGGELALWSGTARCEITDRTALYDDTNGVGFLPGTHCEVIIPADE